MDVEADISSTDYTFSLLSVTSSWHPTQIISSHLHNSIDGVSSHFNFKSMRYFRRPPLLSNAPLPISLVPPRDPVRPHLMLFQCPASQYCPPRLLGFCTMSSFGPGKELINVPQDTLDCGTDDSVTCLVAKLSGTVRHLCKSVISYSEGYVLVFINTASRSTTFEVCLQWRSSVCKYLSACQYCV